LVKRADFAQNVQTVWQDQRFLQETRVQRRLVERLKALKCQIKSWSKQQKRRKLSTLEKLEEGIEASLQGLSGGSQNLAEERHIKRLEEVRNNLLVEEEEFSR